jgi:hypothetical protein
MLGIVLQSSTFYGYAELRNAKCRWTYSRGVFQY